MRSADSAAPRRPGAPGRTRARRRGLRAGDCGAYKGITVSGFPNLFMTNGPNTGVVVNGSAVFFSECQVEYVLRALRHMFKHSLRSINCRPGRQPDQGLGRGPHQQLVQEPPRPRLPDLALGPGGLLGANERD